MLMEEMIWIEEIWIKEVGNIHHLTTDILKLKFHRAYPPPASGLFSSKLPGSRS